jgi:hypothetical protein
LEVGEKMRREIMLCLLIVLAFPVICVSQEALDVPSSIQSPRALSNWLTNEFTYELECPDRWKSPEETISSKAGDCGDFAILSTAILSRMGLSSDIIIVKFRGLDTSHAICVFKTRKGYYNFISNRDLVRTGKKTLEGAVSYFYPDWEEIVFTDRRSHPLKTIRRR